MGPCHFRNHPFARIVKPIKLSMESIVSSPVSFHDGKYGIVTILRGPMIERGFAFACSTLRHINTAMEDPVFSYSKIPRVFSMITIVAGLPSSELKLT